VILETSGECRRGKLWLVGRIGGVNEFGWEVRFELKCGIMGRWRSVFLEVEN